jgi:hypothetical protein
LPSWLFDPIRSKANLVFLEEKLLNTLVQLKVDSNMELQTELNESIKKVGINTESRTARIRGVSANEIIIALGSAGAFTALYQVISQFLLKNKDREITIERKGLKLTLKGHNLLEEKALLEQLAPELISKTRKTK